jgi:hypothetical protein
VAQQKLAQLDTAGINTTKCSALSYSAVQQAYSPHHCSESYSIECTESLLLIMPGVCTGLIRVTVHR